MNDLQKSDPKPSYKMTVQDFVDFEENQNAISHRQVDPGWLSTNSEISPFSLSRQHNFLGIIDFLYGSTNKKQSRDGERVGTSNSHSVKSCVITH